jgi:hypothetical protein
MRTSNTIRFAVAVALLAVSCWLMLAHSLICAFACLFPISFLVPRDLPDLSDAAMRRWLWGVGIALTILVVVVVIAYFHPLLSADTIRRIIFHPAFIVPVWLLMLWSLLRRWRRQRGMLSA